MYVGVVGIEVVGVGCIVRVWGFGCVCVEGYVGLCDGEFC